MNASPKPPPAIRIFRVAPRDVSCGGADAPGSALMALTAAGASMEEARKSRRFMEVGPQLLGFYTRLRSGGIHCPKLWRCDDHGSDRWAFCRGREQMRKLTIVGVVGLVAVMAAVLWAQAPAPSCKNCPGTFIPKSEIDAYVKRAIDQGLTDQQVRQ